jgi:tight adherence protein B
MTIVAVVFLGVLGVVLVPYFLFIVRPEDEAQRKLRKRLKKTIRPIGARGTLVKKRERLSAIPFVESLLANSMRVVTPIQRLISQAGYSMNVGTFVLASMCAGGIPMLIVTLMTRRTVLGVIVGAITAWLPLLWVRHACSKRLWKFEEQFPEAIDLIARALRAGHTFPTGLLMAADELEPPIGTEFRVLYDRQNFGEPIVEALRDFAERTPLLDAKFFATAVLTQREAGGNLAEVLDNLSSVIRERFKVKRQVRVISAHGRITGWILALLPPALALAFTAIDTEHIRVLWEDPMGIRMVYVAVVLEIIGALVIKKLVNIEY